MVVPICEVAFFKEPKYDVITPHGDVISFRYGFMTISYGAILTPNQIKNVGNYLYEIWVNKMSKFRISFKDIRNLWAGSFLKATASTPKGRP